MYHVQRFQSSKGRVLLALGGTLFLTQVFYVWLQWQSIKHSLLAPNEASVCFFLTHEFVDELSPAWAWQGLGFRSASFSEACLSFEGQGRRDSGNLGPVLTEDRANPGGRGEHKPLLKASVQNTCAHFSAYLPLIRGPKVSVIKTSTPCKWSNITHVPWGPFQSHSRSWHPDSCLTINVFTFLFIYLFSGILGLRCGVQASHCCGVSCCRAQDPECRLCMGSECMGSVVAAPGL